MRKLWEHRGDSTDARILWDTETRNKILLLMDEVEELREANKALTDEVEFIKSHSAIPAPGCNYLSPAGMTCFKCGKVHSGTKLALLTTPVKTEGGALP